MNPETISLLPLTMTINPNDKWWTVTDREGNPWATFAIYDDALEYITNRNIFA